MPIVSTDEVCNVVKPLPQKARAPMDLTDEGKDTDVSAEKLWHRSTGTFVTDEPKDTFVMRVAELTKGL